MAIGLTVRFEVKAGSGEAFEAGFRKAAAAVKAQDAGCEMYDLFQSVDDESRFVMVESWASEADLDAHMKSPTMGDVGKALGAFIGGAPVMHRYKD